MTEFNLMAFILKVWIKVNSMQSKRGLTRKKNGLVIVVI